MDLQSIGLANILAQNRNDDGSKRKKKTIP